MAPVVLSIIAIFCALCHKAKSADHSHNRLNTFLTPNMSFTPSQISDAKPPHWLPPPFPVKLEQGQVVISAPAYQLSASWQSNASHPSSPSCHTGSLAARLSSAARFTLGKYYGATGGEISFKLERWREGSASPKLVLQGQSARADELLA